MSSIDFQAPLTNANWEKQKAALAKDKAVAAKLNVAKLTDALKALNRQHLTFPYDPLKGAGAATGAAIEEALKGLEAAVKGDLKDLRASAKQSGTAADELSKAAETLRKTLKGDSANVASAAVKAADAVSTAASAFDRDVGKYIDSVRSDLQGRLDKAKAQEKAQEKKGAAAPAGGRPGVESKAGKLVRTRALECIRKIKKPQPGAKPYRFVVVSGKASVTVYMGPIASTAQEKLLKGLIPDEKPFKTFKDPRGEVIWEKNAVTLVSDRMPAGLAKKMQLWLKKITKLNVKIRIRKTTGEVEESLEGEDISDDKLKPDAADAADAEARKQAGKDFTKRLADLGPAIRAALDGPLAYDIQALVQGIAKAGQAKDYEEADAQLDEVEALLDEAAANEAASPGLSVAQLAKARLAWIGTRTKAISEIKRLAAAIGAAFKDETEQKAKVGEAVTRLYALIPMLGTTLESQLDAALSENDPAKRKAAATKAKVTLDGIVKLLDEDDLLSNLDHNEVVPDMAIVEPMKDRLADIEAALG